MADKESLIKAHFVGAGDIDAPATKQPNESDRNDLFEKAGAIEPPYDPEALANRVEVSNSLRQNLDAYATNIDGFGHRFEPAIDLNKDDAEELVADAIVLERLHEEGPGVDIDDIPEPTEEEVADRVARLRRRSRIEKARAETFFKACAYDGSFVGLRKRTRIDLEYGGNAYWEVLRNAAGQPARFVRMPAHTMRLRKLIKGAVTVQERVPISAVSFTEQSVQRRFRTFVQLSEDGDKVYFKALGDPRTVSRGTGKVYPSPEALAAKEEGGLPATEVIHFALPSLKSAYGVPRWIGNLISVLGSRSAEEVNYYYFENKAVPPMALLVSGGRLAASAVKKIEDYVENNLKGKRNFHKILILEAQVGKAAGDTQAQRPHIELKPLFNAQQHDALFQEYDERNSDKVGSSFRLPRILRGETKDFNRATAEAALGFAEDQVFEPERSEFDDFVNRVILPAIGVGFWRFMSNSPVTRNPETMGKLVAELVKVAVLTPEEGRMLAGDVFNRDFRIINEDWVKQPMQFTLAGIQSGNVAPGAEKAEAGTLQPAQGDPPSIPSIEQDPVAMAHALLRVRNSMVNASADLEAERLEQSRRRARKAEGETVVLEVDAETMGEWVEPAQP